MLVHTLLVFRSVVSASYAAPVPDQPQAETAGVSPGGRLDRLPPQSFFLVSAIFHYLGPSLAVLLFARIDVLGVAPRRTTRAAVASVQRSEGSSLRVVEDRAA